MTRYACALAVLVGATAMTAQAQEFSHADGNCPKCKVGESMVSVTQIVGPGDYVYDTDPSCGGDMNGQVQAMGQALAAYATNGLSFYAGPLVDQATQSLVGFVKQNIQGDVGRFLAPWTNPVANCVVVAALIPPGSEYAGFDYYAWDGVNTNPERCAPGRDCAGGWCKFTMEPDIQKTPQTWVVYTVFKNWSHDRQRAARLEIYFKRPPDKPRQR